MDILGLCVKQSDSSDFATIVFEVRNKSNTEFDIIQNIKTDETAPPSEKSTKVAPSKPTVLNVQIEKLENIPIAEQVRILIIF